VFLPTNSNLAQEFGSRVRLKLETLNSCSSKGFDILTTRFHLALYIYIIGISLNVEQWRKLKSYIDDVDEDLKNV